MKMPTPLTAPDRSRQRRRRRSRISEKRENDMADRFTHDTHTHTNTLYWGRTQWAFSHICGKRTLFPGRLLTCPISLVALSLFALSSRARARARFASVFERGERARLCVSFSAKLAKYAHSCMERIDVCAPKRAIEIDLGGPYRVCSQY